MFYLNLAGLGFCQINLSWQALEEACLTGEPLTRILPDQHILAGAVGIEPTTPVLETGILPLNQAPLKIC